MFERFTQPARRLIFFARYEAQQHSSPTIDPEHLLLAFFREQGPFIKVAAPSLTRDQAERVVVAHKRPQTVTLVERILTRWFGASVSVDLPLSNSSKRVLAYTAEEGERLGDRAIRTGHLFLGLIREKDTPAARLLAEVGVTLAQARGVVKDVAESGPPITESTQAEKSIESRSSTSSGDVLYCPTCAKGVTDPLTCGDCSAVICRACGTPLEAAADLGMG
jgi:ATP-dependent Clp protease ATP-binding subunit ClpC